MHKITATMLAREGDVVEEIRQALKEFTGEEPKVENIEESERKLLTVELKKESQQNDFLKKMVAGLGEQGALVVAQAESRLHEEERDWNFYIRLDKKEYLEGRRMVLTDSGNCVHVKLMLAAYPKKREAAIALVGRLFGSLVKKNI